MAKQKGIIKLEGTIGDITFYKSPDGFLAKGKGGISADKIANDPAFQRTRENGAEFGRAGKAGKLLRNAIRGLLINASDRLVVSRLTTDMVKVIQADATSVRGLRNVIDGESEMLKGFEFNNRGRLATCMFANYDAEIFRPDGKITINIPSFIPQNMLVAPGGSTHYKLVAAGLEIDFENETFKIDNQETVTLPWDNVASADINFVHAMTPASTHPLFVVLGISFYQSINGVMYSLKNGAYNALSIVKVDGGV